MISGAEHVFGGARHLALAESLIRGASHRWPTPFDTRFEAIRALEGRAVCVLASGDPFLHGVGASLARQFAAEAMAVEPAPSAFSLAASRLGWALQDIETVSLHGRPIELVRPLLHPGRRILALTSDAAGPAALATLLSANGFGPSRLTVLEALGGARERARTSPARDFRTADIDPLNLIAIEVGAEPEARIIPLTSGLADDLFEHDGQITKRAIRAITLSALAPRRGELLWDVGAGAGSIAIEWMLADPSMRAVAIEVVPERAARIGRNAAALGVPGLVIVSAAAPSAFEGLEMPDAIFVGGGGSDPDVMEASIAALRQGGRLVANAVTLEMEAVLLDLHDRLGGELTRIGVSRAEPLGGMTGWRPAMPVTQWSWLKS